MGMRRGDRKSSDCAPTDADFDEDYYDEGGNETRASREERALDSMPNEAADAFGGVPDEKAAAKGAIKKPQGLDGDEKLHLPWVQHLFEHLGPTLDTTDPTRFTADVFYNKIQPALKTAYHESCLQVREDRRNGSSQYADGKTWHEAVRTPGRLVWGPASQPLRNKKTPITAESRVPAPSGDNNQKIYPQLVLDPGVNILMTVVGGSRDDREMTAEFIKKYPHLALQYVRMRPKGQPIKRLAGEREPIVVEGGARLRTSAVLDLTWINFMRYEDIVSYENTWVSAESAASLLESLMSSKVDSLKNFAAKYNLQIADRPKITRVERKTAKKQRAGTEVDEAESAKYPACKKPAQVLSFEDMAEVEEKDAEFRAVQDRRLSNAPPKAESKHAADIEDGKSSRSPMKEAENPAMAKPGADSSVEFGKPHCSEVDTTARTIDTHDSHSAPGSGASSLRKRDLESEGRPSDGLVQSVPTRTDEMQSNAAVPQNTDSLEDIFTESAGFRRPAPSTGLLPPDAVGTVSMSDLASVAKKSLNVRADANAGANGRFDTSSGSLTRPNGERDEFDPRASTSSDRDSRDWRNHRQDRRARSRSRDRRQATGGSSYQDDRSYRPDRSRRSQMDRASDKRLRGPRPHPDGRSQGDRRRDQSASDRLGGDDMLRSDRGRDAGSKRKDRNRPDDDGEEGYDSGSRKDKKRKLDPQYSSSEMGEKDRDDRVSPDDRRGPGSRAGY